MILSSYSPRIWWYYHPIPPGLDDTIIIFPQDWMIMLMFRLMTHSLSAAITFHNPENKAKKGGICVANHTSPLDAVILRWEVSITCGPSMLFLTLVKYQKIDSFFNFWAEFQLYFQILNLNAEFLELCLQSALNWYNNVQRWITKFLINFINISRRCSLCI